MSITTVTTQEINDNIIAQIQANLNQTVPLLPKSFTRVIAKTLAGVFILLYKYGGFIFLQMFVDTASFQETEVNGRKLTPLLELGSLVGAENFKQASNAEMRIEITVETQGGILPSGSQLVNSENGVTYITVSSVLLNAATVTADILAVSDQSGGNGSGALGNLQVNDVVSFANSLGNVNRDAIVLEQLVTAADAETEQSYRQRVKDRFQKRPQGGASADYELWGESAEGILNVYPYTGARPGEVDLYVEATVASSGNSDGIPTAAQLQSVQDAVQLSEDGLADRRPLGTLVNVSPITRLDFTVSVVNLTADDLAALQTQIAEGVREYLLSREPFITGLTAGPRRDRVTNSAISGVVEDLVSANSGVFDSVNVSLNGVLTPVYTLGLGEKAKSTSITFL